MSSAISGSDPLWRPDPARATASLLANFIAHVRRTFPALPPASDPNAFAALHEWSITALEPFWSAVWHHAGLIASARSDGSAWEQVLVGGDRLAPPDPINGPKWFTGSRLNFAENLLRSEGTTVAIAAWDERGPLRELSRDQLRDEVRRTAAGLRALGVTRGDRVAGWLPNIPEAVVAMLAASVIGAVWTSCSPDFGVDGIVDRFGQTEPVVLLYCDGYRYDGKVHDCSARAEELLARLPTLRHAVMISYLGAGQLPADPRAVRYELLPSDPDPLEFDRLPFDHPLYVLYSSGTTGLPKCMVHSTGGTLLQHMKEHRLHCDIRDGERLFYFTTCGWMMWNWQVSALASGATLVLYDGAPMPAAEPGILWRLANEAAVDVFGTSARYLALAEKTGLMPSRDHALPQLRAILSTGSPLAPESFDWCQRAIGPRVQVSSISGGTDIVSCFVLGNPITPVWRGEIQGPGLGMSVDVFDDAGERCPIGTAGELVCTRPFPSMPVAFWNDPDRCKYRDAYFDRYPGVWRHGDWVARTAHGGYVISGRSDATLNPGGVRIGTAEIYRQIESISEIMEGLVIGQQIPGGAVGDERIVLFVRLREGLQLDPVLIETIRKRIRTGTSPHHVPRVIVQVQDLPRTRSGKLSETAARDAVANREVRNVGALANPEALEHFRNRPELEN